VSSKVTKAEMTDRFQDGCRRQVRNSSECYKMDNYRPMSMKIGTQTKKNMLILKSTLRQVWAKFKIAAAATWKLKCVL
jgi:hypothetical protein